MNQWSRNRKRIILALIFFVIFVVIGLPIYFLFYRAPTCTDGRENGDETGVDCGGSCQRLCTTESLPLILRGDPRVLKVKDNTFELVALAENPNSSAEIYRAGYTFKIYDNIQTAPIKVIEGETYVPKGATFAIFEGPFVLEPSAIASRVTFEWKEESLVWRKDSSILPALLTKGVMLENENIRPKLNVSIENASLEDVSNIELVALISNETGNIFAVSKTFVVRLLPGESAPAVFTWPTPFSQRVGDIKIITRIFPDGSFLR